MMVLFLGTKWLELRSGIRQTVEYWLRFRLAYASTSQQIRL
jgi:hypothetical protein